MQLPGKQKERERVAMIKDYLNFWKNSFRFTGRTSKYEECKEAFAQFAFSLLIFLSLLFLIWITKGERQELVIIIKILDGYVFLSYVPMLSLFVRRVRDVRKPWLWGAWALVCYVAVTMLVLLLSSSDGANGRVLFGLLFVPFVYYWVTTFSPPTYYAVSNDREAFNIVIERETPYPSEVCCIGLDERGRFKNPAYLIDRDNPCSPLGEIMYYGVSNGAGFTVNLSSLPREINCLRFVIGPIKKKTEELTVRIRQPGVPERIPFAPLGIKEPSTAIALDLRKRKSRSAKEASESMRWGIEISIKGSSRPLPKYIELLKPVEKK